MSQALRVDWRGEVGYAEALALQEESLALRRSGKQPDLLLLLEHPQVLTLGRSSREENLLVSRAELVRRGVAIHEVARGGDVTYHAPGQLVGYPIFDLQARSAKPDVHVFLRELEAALIDAIGTFGIAGRRIEGMTGVFVERALGDACDRKIASIGIGVRHWISYHGFALNVSLDLSGFDLIVPCGLSQVEMTSVAAEIERRGERVAADALDAEVRAAVEGSFRKRFPQVAATQAGSPAPR